LLPVYDQLRQVVGAVDTGAFTEVNCDVGNSFGYSIEKGRRKTKEDAKA